MSDVEQLAASIRAGHGVEGNVMEIIPSCLRAAFAVSSGKKFVCADLSQIELRVLAWLTGCAPMLDAFAAERDLYLEFGSAWYHVPYDQVTKLQRQNSKPAVLQCGYGAGGGELKYEYKCAKCKKTQIGVSVCKRCGSPMGEGDPFKTGLWGYAESMGVPMTQGEAHDAVDLYRGIYPEIPRFWYGLEDKVRRILEANERTVVWDSTIKASLSLVPGKLLYVTLPSGRRLHYLRPAVLDRDITFEGIDGKTKQWGRRKLYGSLLTENIVQAIARDILAVGMARAVDAGFDIVAHTHDELLCEVDVLDKRHNLTYLCDLMTEPIEWASGLLIKAEGWEGDVYRK